MDANKCTWRRLRENIMLQKILTFATVISLSILINQTVAADSIEYGSVTNGLEFNVSNNSLLNNINTNSDWGTVGEVINQENEGIIIEDGVGFTHFPVLNFGEITESSLDDEQVVQKSDTSYKVWPLSNVQQVGDQSVITRPYLQIVDQRSDKDDQPLSISVRMTQPFQGMYREAGSDKIDVQPNLLVRTVPFFDYSISGLINTTGHFTQNWGGELGAGSEWTFGPDSLEMTAGPSADSFGTMSYEYGSLKNQTNIEAGSNGNRAGTATYNSNERIKNGIYLELPRNIVLKSKSYQAEYTWSIVNGPNSDS